MIVLLMETNEEISLFHNGKAVEDGEADKEEDSKKMVISEDAEIGTAYELQQTH